MKLVLAILLLIPSLAFAGGQLGLNAFGNDVVVGGYHLNENAGVSVNDATGKGNTGKLENAPVWVSGQFGSALTFPVNNSRVIFNNTTVFGFLRTDPFYVVVRVKIIPGNPGAGPLIIGKGNSISTANGYRLVQQVGAINDFEWRVRGAAAGGCTWRTDALPTTHVLFDNRKWHTMIGWWDGRNICPSGGGMYIDGEAPAYANLAGASVDGDFTSAEPATIGGPATQPGEYFGLGTIDEAYYVKGIMTPQKAKRIHALFSMQNSRD